MSSNHNKLISICCGQYAFITVDELEIKLLLVDGVIRKTLQATNCLLRFRTIHCEYLIVRKYLYQKLIKNYKLYVRNEKYSFYPIFQWLLIIVKLKSKIYIYKFNYIYFIYKMKYSIRNKFLFIALLTHKIP